jgi:hypothetical protein
MPILRRPPTLSELFERNEGRLAHKWVHYFEIYERHLARFRGSAPRVLEIGVSHGGSLDLWRSWLGRGTEVVGIDINPRVTQLSRRHVRVLVGDQSDAAFLAELVAQHGPFDIVIDDGSHLSRHQIASLEALWPTMPDGGVYVVEDTHANYWDEYEGGLGRPTTFIECAKGLVDDLHAFHSRSPEHRPSDWTRTLDGIHFYDSVVVLERRDRDPPVHRKSGRPAFDTLYGKDVWTMIDDEHAARIEEMNRPWRRARRALRHPVRTIENVVDRRRHRRAGER